MPSSILFALAILVLSTAFADADELASAFLRKHCIRCHGDEKQKADRRFDILPAKIRKLDDLERYQEIVDQLNLESMPPESEPQPTAEERARAIAELTQKLTAARAELNTSGGHSVLRRLNSWEYRHTIGDLLRLNVDVWDPAEDFPEEVKVDGFDNNGASLVTSGILIIILVFLPLLSLQGLEGKLFRPVARTIVYALAGSLLLSLTVIPVLASFLIRDGAHQEPFLPRKLAAWYRPMLDRALQRESLVLIPAAVLLVASLVAESLMSSLCISCAAASPTAPSRTSNAKRS